MDHGEECQCCKEGVGAMVAWESQMMEKHGWYVHYVPSSHDDFLNVHTHGLSKTFGHKDLQLVVPLPTDVCQSIFWNLARRIEKGEKFEVGQRASQIIRGMDVTFTDAVENDRDVLRIVLPDKEGNLDVEEMDGLWSKQWTVKDAN